MSFVLPALLAGALAAAPLPKIAVLEIRALDAASKGQVELVQEVILTDLARTRQFEVIGASDISAMLGFERQKQLLGCSESAGSCLAELGGALGAEYVLVGSMARLDQSRRVDLKLLDAKRNKVIAREYASATSDSGVVDKVHDSLMSLVGAIPGLKPAAPAAVQPNAVSSSSPGGAPSWLPMATTILGGALAVGGGGYAAYTVNDYYSRRRELNYADIPGVELQRNLGIGAAVAGAAVAGVGVFLWTRSPRTSLSLAPTAGGLTVGVAGVLP